MSRLTRKFNVPPPTDGKVPSEIKIIEDRLKSSADKLQSSNVADNKDDEVQLNFESQSNKNSEKLDKSDKSDKFDKSDQLNKFDRIDQVDKFDRAQALRNECEKLWKANPQALEYLKNSGVSLNLNKFKEDGLEQLIDLTKSVPKLLELDNVALKLMALTSVMDSNYFPHLSNILKHLSDVSTFREMLLNIKLHISDTINDKPEYKAFIQSIANAAELDLHTIAH